MEDQLAHHVRKKDVFVVVALLDSQDFFLMHILELLSVSTEFSRQLLGMDKVVDDVLQFLQTPLNFKRVIYRLI